MEIHEFRYTCNLSHHIHSKHTDLMEIHEFRNTCNLSHHIHSKHIDLMKIHEFRNTCNLSFQKVFQIKNCPCITYLWPQHVLSTINKVTGTYEGGGPRPPPLKGAHINNLLTLIVCKCEYDRIVYIVKKGINIFSKKGFLS